MKTVTCFTPLKRPNGTRVPYHTEQKRKNFSTLAKALAHCEEHTEAAHEISRKG